MVFLRTTAVTPTATTMARRVTVMAISNAGD
jgi:hypothetical protein